MSSEFYFVIVGPKDNPIYETDASWQLGKDKKGEQRHLSQFIVHAALDMVDEVQWTTNTMYLKSVDKFNEWLVSAYVTAGNVRFLLLHNLKTDDGIRSFFVECHELYIKILLNPFYDIYTPIVSELFDSKVKAIAKKFL